MAIAGSGSSACRRGTCSQSSSSSAASSPQLQASAGRRRAPNADGGQVGPAECVEHARLARSGGTGQGDDGPPPTSPAVGLRDDSLGLGDSLVGNPASTQVGCLGEAPEPAPPNGQSRPYESARVRGRPSAPILTAGFDDLGLNDVIGARTVELGQLATCTASIAGRSSAATSARSAPGRLDRWGRPSARAASTAWAAASVDWPVPGRHRDHPIWRDSEATHRR